jgi:class 3 adenylate cyclase
VDVLGRRRVGARESDASELVTGPLPSYLNPRSVRDHRAIAAAFDRMAHRTELVLARVLMGTAVATALLVLVMWAELGAPLASRQLALCAVGTSYFGLSWYLLHYGTPRRAAWLRWVNTTVEPTFVTIGILNIAQTNGPEWAATAGAMALYGVAVAVNVYRMKPLLCAHAAIVAIVGYLAVYFGAIEPNITDEMRAHLPPLATWGAWERAFWIALTAGVLAFATTRLRKLAMTRGTELWRRQRVEAEFGRFVSPDVAQAILRGAAGAGAAERREVTVLFCDLRDFTGLCEKETPEQVVALLNTFFEEACRIVREHGGTVNKFLGDGMLALFGAPDEHPNHAQAAAAAAHEMIYAVDRLRERGGVWKHLDVGIGLDTGPVVCGAVGAQTRLEYTAIGSVVNRGARLQGLTRKAHRRIVVSESCVRALGPRANVVSFGEVQLKGFDEPVPVYAFRHS